jgi:predicted amidohydrolase YtcJ
MHPLEAGSPVGGHVQLTSDTSPEQMIQIIKNSAPGQIGTNWVLGHGYSLHSILEFIEKGGRTPRDILDEALPNTPAIMMEETSHSVWVNSKALSLAGLDRNTPNTAAGIIMKDEKTGEPNGILLENAGNAIIDLAMTPTPELEELNYEGLLTSLKIIAENGITSICDARTYWKSNHHKAWQRALANGKLTARTILCLWTYPHLKDEEQIPSLKAMYNYNPDSLLRVSQIKMYSDGLLESTTAAVLQPYLINYHFEGMSDNKGMKYFDTTRMEKYLRELQSFDAGKGFDFNIHTIGDQGVRDSLTAIQQTLPFQDSTRFARHRLTHVEMVNASDIPRFAALGVTADFQVAGYFTLPSHRAHNDALIGPEKANNTIPVKSLWESGASVTLSSDWDVSNLNPFIGIQHATQRGHQAVSVKIAVEMYTINAAYAMRQEDRVGSLVPGKEADFIVVNKNIFVIPTSQISETTVLQTVVKGKEVFRSPLFAKGRK